MARRRGFAFHFALGVAALLAPGVSALALAWARVGERPLVRIVRSQDVGVDREPTGVNARDQRAAMDDAAFERADALSPPEWAKMWICEQRRAFGVVKMEFRPMRLPRAWDRDVRLWRLVAGWPFSCVEACWRQDGRFDWYGGPNSPFAPSEEEQIRRPEHRVWERGLNAPTAYDEAPDASWLPIKPLAAGYFANSVLWYAFLLVGASAFSGMWRRSLGARRAHRGLCSGCGYPMGGEGCCPECGRAWVLPQRDSV